MLTYSKNYSSHVEVFTCEGHFIPCTVKLERIQIVTTNKSSYHVRDFVVNLQ
jgi:hypothetical protein